MSGRNNKAQCSSGIIWNALASAVCWKSPARIYSKYISCTPSSEIDLFFFWLSGYWLYVYNIKCKGGLMQNFSSSHFFPSFLFFSFSDCFLLLQETLLLLRWSPADLWAVLLYISIVCQPSASIYICPIVYIVIVHSRDYIVWKIYLYFMHK
jgi:hypothetical protein